jgi:hypothetical protein
MAVYDLYSKRRMRQRGEVPDVYSYDVISEALRTQVIHIWHDVIGLPGVNPPKFMFVEQVREVYQTMTQTLRREYGLVKLFNANAINPNDQEYALLDLESWFRREENTERVLDAIELSFKVIEGYCSKRGYLNRSNAETVASDAVEELNIRFKEHGLGYQFNSSEIIRVDSEVIHSEAVIPALTVLRGPEYANAQEEFLRAFEHFRHGNKQEALVECCKCFESTMKVICNKRGWAAAAGATSSELIRICFDNGLIPSYWQNHFNGLRSILESGIPTPRNRRAGHGAGSGPAPDIPDELVSYVLHMTASTVLFLAESEKRL